MRRFAVGRLPSDPAAARRPILGVEVRGRREVHLPCLIDTGSLHVRMPEWVAVRTGIDLDAIDGVRIGLGGQVVEACPAHVAIATAAGELITTVWFCRGWHSPFGLLGQEGFLDRYRLTLDVAEGWFALQPH